MSKQVFIVVKAHRDTALRCMGIYTDKQKAEEFAILNHGFLMEAAKFERLPGIGKARGPGTGEKSLSTLVVEDVEVPEAEE